MSSAGISLMKRDGALEIDLHACVAALALDVQDHAFAEFTVSHALPELRERLATLGAEPISTGPAEFETMMRSYIAYVRKLGEAIGMKAE